MSYAWEKKMNKIKIFTFHILDFEKISKTLSNFHNWRVNGSCFLLFCILLLCFCWAAFIHCMQVAILNLPHPYLRSTTLLIDAMKIVYTLYSVCAQMKTVYTRRLFPTMEQWWKRSTSRLPYNRCKVFLYICHVYVLLIGPSLLQMKFCRNFVPP